MGRIGDQGSVVDTSTTILSGNYANDAPYDLSMLSNLTDLRSSTIDNISMKSIAILEDDTAIKKSS